MTVIKKYIRSIPLKYYTLIFTFIVFAIYLTTLAPGLVEIDSGELAAAAITLGIAHPTGYPTFTILGFVFSKLLFFVSKIYAMNIFAAICTTVGFYFVVKINFHLFTQLKSTAKIEAKTAKKKTQIKAKLDDSLILLFSIVSALTLAFSKTFWKQSTSVEVYSLHLAFISSAIYFFLKAVDLEETKTAKATFALLKNKYWLLFSITLGLSFTNHLTSILLIPAFAYYYFSKYGFNKSSFKRIFILVVPFIISLSFYLYLPLNAMSNPEINWGNPIDFERFKRHIMGWQYQSWIFSSTESASKQFKYYINNFPNEFTIIGLIVIVVGLFALIKQNRKILYFTLLLFITCILYSINYDIADIDAYFLLSYLSSSIFITSFLIFVFNKFSSQSNQSFLKNIFFALPLIVVFINYPTVNQSQNVQIHQYSENVLESFEPNAIAISYLWDFWVSPSYYLQFVEKKRKDVAVIDKELLRRSWYFNQIKRNYPKIYQSIQSDVEKFLPELLKFERGQKYDAQILETYYQKIIVDLIIKNIGTHPIYLGTEIVTNELKNGQLILPDSLKLVPDLFLFKVVLKDEYYPVKNLKYKIDFSNDESYYTSTLKNLIAVTHINRALYEKRFNNLELSKKFVDLALE
ncbi:MAG: DUF2723 domain-containing protein, partial [Ignavibacteria bacterium]|nr:DUF2723 domain-containing protein [Ignavibacteria bacterium]